MQPIIARDAEWKHLRAFATAADPEAMLALVWGRRRIGKSMLLQGLAQETGGFYFHAQRGSSGEALVSLGEALAEWIGAPAPLALSSWDQAVSTIMALGRDRPMVVVLDEFPYLLEHTPELDSILQRHFGPGHPSSTGTRARLILCGSAVSVMTQLRSGTAPLRGRAGLNLLMLPFDFRVSRELHASPDLATAVKTYAVIGGVAAYARQMVQNDVPVSAADFDRWVCERVLSPAAPLFSEIDVLLAEDPTMAKARKINLYQAVLAGIALGNHAPSSLTSYAKMPGHSLVPILDTLVATALVSRVEDPVRDNRPVYRPNDSLLRFHYAVIRKHRDRLARTTDPRAMWQGLTPTFASQVMGPCFEAMAREWTTHHAGPSTLGTGARLVGSTTLSTGTATHHELDVIVADGDADSAPDQRTIIALGEAKLNEELTTGHLAQLENARSALGVRAADAKLLLFGSHIGAELRRRASRRSDVELVDLKRLYFGE